MRLRALYDLLGKLSGTIEITIDIGSALHAGPHRIAVGLDINATHHRAARSGWVTGTATALSLGNTLASYEVVVTDDQDKRICTCRITCLLRDAAPGA